MTDLAIVRYGAERRKLECQNSVTAGHVVTRDRQRVYEVKP